MFSGEKKKRSQTPRSPTDQELKKLERLIQLTVRAFFSPIDIVVIDELVRRRSKVKDQALAQLLNLRAKEVQSSLYRMKKNLMVTLEMRNEKNQVVTSQEESGSSEPHHRKFIDYPKFMDMLRYKLCSLSKPLREETEYFECPRCRKKYDIYRHFETINCDQCQVPLKNIKPLNSGAEMNLGALTVLMEHLKQCEDVPFPKFDGWITEVESDDEQQARPKSHHGMAKPGQKPGVEGKIEIVVDLDVKHPASICILPQENDQTSSNKGPPPWMKKPVDITLANTGKLILPAPPKKETGDPKNKQETLHAQVVHWPSKDGYRRYYAGQMKGKR